MSQANHDMGQWIALLTRQGTEQVIAPILEPALACRIERGSGFDTDRLGSCTRDIPRSVSQLDASRRSIWSCVQAGRSSPGQGHRRLGWAQAAL